MGEYHDLQASNNDEDVQLRFLTPVSSILSVLSSLNNEERNNTSRWPSYASAQRSKLSSNLGCAICFEALISEDGNVYSVPGCGHMFHEECLRRWKREKATCPFCRGPLPEELGETDGSVDISDDMDYIVRRLHEIIQEMEGNQANQTLTWQTVLANVLISPVGIFLPPLLLLLLWTVEIISFAIGIVVLPFYVIFLYLFEVNGRTKLWLILLMILCYPVVIALGVLSLVVFQILYSILVSISFYIKILRCQRQWTDAYKDIVQGTLGYLEERIEHFID